MAGFLNSRPLCLLIPFSVSEQANNRGVGVIGVIECNFLKPTHNKQDFDYTDEYRYWYRPGLHHLSVYRFRDSDNWRTLKYSWKNFVIVINCHTKTKYSNSMFYQN